MWVPGELIYNVLMVGSKTEVDDADGLFDVDGHDCLEVLSDLPLEGFEVVLVKGLSRSERLVFKDFKLFFNPFEDVRATATLRYLTLWQ